jgi:NADH-quinone oxidoreductase subunit I
MGLFKDIKNLLIGMRITGKHLGRHAITLQYPEEKWPMPERSRGIVVLLSDKETGDLNCTSCMLCMRACPTAAISIVSPRGEDKKRHLEKFEIDFGLCCFCGLCEEACSFSAIKMAPKYEFSTENKADLTWDVNKLQEMGRDVDYIDTRKKKTPKPKPTAEVKPTADQSDTPKPPEAPKQPEAPEAPEKSKPPETPKPGESND